MRTVAKGCESTGQRVPQSVNECQESRAGFEELERRLLDEINLTEDCLRLYRMPETRGAEVKEYGIFKAVDFEGPLVL